MGHTHGFRWTDEEIKRSVREVVSALELDRMPSRFECVGYFGNNALACKIAKRPGGWYALAAEMNLPTKDSATKTGKTHEYLVCEMLGKRGFEIEKMPQNFPYDILANGGVKIDVKASHLYRGPQGDFYAFNLEKKRATCDIYILVTLSDENEIADVFVVPSVCVVSNTQISIGKERSKYHKFRDKWEYVAAFAGFLERVSAGGDNV